MNTKALRQKILDLAIHGKLVPQNPKDESATVLLERIRAEKDEKIKRGELKADKKDSFIFVGSDKRHYEQFADGTVKDIEDELPFDVPEGWAWCRLPELCTIPITDGTHNTPTYSDKKNGIPFLSSKDVTSGKIDWSKIKYITKKLHDELYKRLSPQKNDILLAKNGTTGVAAIVEDDSIFDIYVTLAVVRPNVKIIIPNYLLLLINSPFCKKQFNGHLTGIGVPNLHLVDINKTLIPLPPINEQNLILFKTEKILNKTDALESNKSALQTAIKQAKSKILDLAIHGKLVPQDPNDEPAKELLKRIATGDNRPYKKFEDEVPFEIPENWGWCKLGDIGKYKKGPFGSSLTKAMFVPKSSNTVKVYEQKNAIQKNHNLGEYYITREYFESKMKSFEVFPNDVIVSCAGTIGETYILPENIEQGIINQALMKMKISKFIDINYFLKYFDHILKEESVKNGKGTAIKNIPPFDVFKNYPVPLPPLAEQQRIVTKIEELFAQLDSISEQLA